MDEELQDSTETVTLQVQQFMDEWHYRVLHSGVAAKWDRTAAVRTALMLFSMHGVQLTGAEVNDFCDMEELDMVNAIVDRMPQSSRSTFEHFALQLQLIVSTATRLRRALEDDSAVDAEKALDGADSTGITSQILKQTVMQAGIEVAELRDRHESWLKNSDLRMSRLTRCADDADRANSQLAAIQSQLSEFGGSQNQKSKKMLTGMAANRDSALLKSIFSSWLGDYLKFKATRDIHEKFRAQIDRAEQKLIEYKQTQMNNVRNVLMRKANEGDGALIQSMFKVWFDDVNEKKNEGGNVAALKLAQDKLAGYKTSQAENTKKVMMRMNAGSDASLCALIFQSWNAWLQEYLKDKEFEDKVKAAEKQVQEHLKKKSEEARGVLDRMSAGSDTGLLHTILTNWVSIFQEEKKAREMEAILNGDGKVKELGSRQRTAANGVVARANRQEQLNILMVFFENWASDNKIEKVIKTFDAKINQRKQMLQGVQGMFANITAQVGKNADDSPRDKKYGKQKTVAPVP